jgi:Rrf2 family cysteine metabolism transcriptional repressor
VHILLQLKRAGIVTSTRGAGGGYLLARPPEEISLLDIYLAIEGPVECPATVTAGLAAKSRNAAVLKHAWEAACQAGAGTLSSQSLADLVARSLNTVEPMYFI